MQLPKCVRVDVRDVKSQHVLESEGWRPIGVCEQWFGQVIGKPRGAKRNPNFIADVDEYGFSGRLWRDPEISRQTAAWATTSYIKSHPNVFTLNDGFGAFTRCGERLTIDLIGVIERGNGTAQDIIRTVIDELDTVWLAAGTYSDNISAVELYRSIGLERKWADMVFHK